MISVGFISVNLRFKIYARNEATQTPRPRARQIRSRKPASQTRELTQKLDQRPQTNMAQRCEATLAHRDPQYPKTRSHREILMLIRLFASTRRLMMNALRRRHVIHLPLPTKPVTQIEILARRTAREERSKTTDRLK